jgi:Flp pilus assembly protein TadG
MARSITICDRATDQAAARTGHGDARRRGIVATELALAIPVLLLFALACADFGRIIYFDEIVSNAARTGAETGASHKFTAYTRSTWEAGVQQAVLDEMQNTPSFSAGQMTYVLSTTTDSDGMTVVTVDVTYPFQPAIAWPSLPKQVNLHQRCVCREFR